MTELLVDIRPIEEDNHDNLEVQVINDPRTLLNLEFVRALGVDDLILKGYGQEGEDVVEQLAIDYEKATTVYLAIKDGKAIGSLAVRELSLSDDPLAQKFIQGLQEAGIINVGDRVLHVEGSVVDDRHRGQGISSKLMNEAARVSHPKLIVGETKTPAAVAVRARIPGAITFIGRQRIGGPVAMKAKEVALADMVVDAYTELSQGLLGDLWLAKHSNFTGNGLYLVSPEYLASDVPDPRDNMREAFAPLIDAQTEENSTRPNSPRTVVAPLITFLQ